jgi:tripartite ATP-independent transporter DctM subunit
MSTVFFGVLAIIIFLILMFLGMNIPFSMVFAAAISILLFKGPAVAGQIISSQVTDTFSNYSLTVGPMFGLMGFLATYTGIGEKLFRCLKAFIGHHRGGLAAAVQVASAGFGAICGTPPAACATMTAVAYPEMRKTGYSVELSALCIVAGGSLSALIPPSATMIVYGIMTEYSISRLFIAGIVPGIILTIVDIATIFVLVRIHPTWGPAVPKSTNRERWESVKNGGIVEVAVVFFISMGGMFTGFFTPTEAGAVGVFGMLIVTLVGRNLNFKKLRHALIEGLRLTAMMYMLMGFAMVFGRALSMSKLPFALADFVSGNDFSPSMVLFIIIAIYFVFGMFADLMSMVLVTIPVFAPLVVDYCGYSHDWFATVIVVMIAIGAMTPPVGNSIFMEKIFLSPFDPDVKVSRLFAACWPWVGQKFILLLLIIFIPSIVTFLPNLLTS